MNLNRFKQSWIDSFPGEDNIDTRQRQTPNKMYAQVRGETFPAPELIHFNTSLACSLDWPTPETEQDIAFLSGTTPKELKTYATAYAGHQFGQWAGQLGDGRAIFAGEILNKNLSPIEIQWKGSGLTPYSRRGDGKAVLRSSIREYLVSEAMFHLGIPTTRALSLIKTGQRIARDLMYSGNIEYEDGAVVLRTAKSFTRFGHFQFLQMHENKSDLKKLADFTIERFFPELIGKSNLYLNFYKKVINRTQDMIVQWWRVGFTHGVMNTDNMSILGLTIDYGPFGFLDDFDLDFTPNTTDLPGRRYAFGNQLTISLWNLMALGNALAPLFEQEEDLNLALIDYEKQFKQKFDEMIANKFGFQNTNENISLFTRKAIAFLDKTKYDYTLFFKSLEKDIESLSVLDFNDSDYHNGKYHSELEDFLSKYKEIIKQEGLLEIQRLEIMKKTNPWFIPRNYILYECIEGVKNKQMDLFLKVFKALQNPYENAFPELSKKRPNWAVNTPGCSTLSCSS